jgi:hypothetical protein
MDQAVERVIIGTFAEADWHAATEQEQRDLDAQLEHMVLDELESAHTHTVLPYIPREHDVTPIRPCRFIRDPVGSNEDPNNVLLFTCRVENNKIMAAIPLASPFVRRMHVTPEDLADYTHHMRESIRPGTSRFYEKTNVFQTPGGEHIRICVTYMIDRRRPPTRTAKNFLLFATNPAEFAQLLDVLLGTQIGLCEW